MCLVFKVSRSSFYYWLSCPESKRRNENIQILETIKAIRQSEPKKEVYGALRMLKDLNFYSGEIGHVFRMKSATDSGGKKAS
jgi:hypothetical protein